MIFKPNKVALFMLKTRHFKRFTGSEIDVVSFRNLRISYFQVSTKKKKNKLQLVFPKTILLTICNASYDIIYDIASY